VHAPGGTRQFRRSITLPTDRTLTSAKVSLAADNSFTLSINGQSVASGNDWTQPVVADITASLQPGDNNLTISASNTDNAAGLIARFYFTFSNGESLTVVTDAQWQASTDGSQWSNARSLGTFGIAPWGAMSSQSLPHPWMRRNFKVKSKPERALVYVNTPGFFELYLNGKKVSDDVLNPAYSDFDKRMFAVAYDVTSMLQPGTNCIALDCAWLVSATVWQSPRLADCARPARYRDGRWNRNHRYGRKLENQGQLYHPDRRLGLGKHGR